MQKISQEIIEQVLKEIEEEVNITKIARILGRNVSTIWFKISGNRKWDVETWLRVLNVLGIMRYKNGKIIIDCKLTPGVEKKFRENYKRYF
jgi:hypothetical protein